MSDELMALTGYTGGDGQRRMIALADEFKAVCQDRVKRKEKPWLVKIGPGFHPRIEAWQYLGQRAGVLARTAEDEEIRNPVTGEFEGYRSVSEAVLISTGQVIGRAVQVCYADEVVKKKDGTIYRRWLDEEGKPNRHAILGMSQTRAQSRVLASALRFLAELAGAEGTPAEEMDGVGSGNLEEQRAPIQEPRSKPAPSSDGREEVVGTVNHVAEKTGKNQKGPWTRYGVKIGGEYYGTFSDTVGNFAHAAKETGNTVVLVWEQDGQHKNIVSLEYVSGDLDL